VGLVPLGGWGRASQPVVRALAVLPGGRRVLTACQNTENARLIDLTSQTEVQQYLCRSRSGVSLWGAAVVALDLHEDGERLLTGGWDRLVRVWSVSSARELRRFAGHRRWWRWWTVTGVAWLSGDRALSAGGDGAVWVWDTLTGRALASLPQPSGVTCLARSPCGRFVALGCRDGIVRLVPVD
jgi:WD40 repeat protein